MVGASPQHHGHGAVQVTEAKLQCDFLAMAASEEWRNKVTVISSIVKPVDEQSLAWDEFRPVVLAAFHAIQENPSHKARLSGLAVLSVEKSCWNFRASWTVKLSSWLYYP